MPDNDLENGLACVSSSVDSSLVKVAIDAEELEKGAVDAEDLIIQGGDKVLCRLRGRHILLISTTVYGTMLAYWTAVAKGGVQVHLVASEPHPKLEQHLESILVLPQLTKLQPESECLPVILSYINENQIPLSACVTFDDRCPLLVSLVCEALIGNPHLVPVSEYGDVSVPAALPHDSSEVLSLCQSKEAVYQHLRSHSATVKYVPNASRLIESVEDVKDFLRVCPPPVVIKPNSGHDALGVRMLETEGDCLEHFAYLTQSIKDMTNAISHACKDNKISMCEFLIGDYILVSIVIWDGQLSSWFICKGGPLLPPDLYLTTVYKPSGYGADCEESVAQAAYECCLQVGLRNGVYDVEMIRDTDGSFVKLIEINTRVTGSACSYNMVDRGQANYLHAALGVAAGLKPTWLEISTESNNKSFTKASEGNVMVEYALHQEFHNITESSVDEIRAACRQTKGCAVQVDVDLPERRSLSVSASGNSWREVKKEILWVLESVGFLVTKDGRNVQQCFTFHQ